ncbi:MAG: DNA-processing protein DprA [Paracoccaceae bacterium]|nr:DNA-processing protein DprA [Paracoccaceae bacterium]
MAKDLSPSTHPLTPPLTEEEWLSWLRLLRSRRVGVTTFFRLMSEHGSASAALDALPEVAAQAGVDNYQPCTVDAARAEWDRAREKGAQAICFGTKEYPAPLAEIPDPPPFLWCIGDTSLLRRPMIALIGARNASSLGTRMARKLAKELGEEGFVVVSGLARGVDAAAHHAALDSGTVAVMAGGVDVIYPKENVELGQEIQNRGLRISEIAMSVQPIARHFPRRNRIISGLARAVVVIEAAAKSGSLITARNALDQGRDVLAVPGHPFDPRGSGCNMLIRDGATLVRSAADVIEALQRPVPTKGAAPKATAAPKPVTEAVETRKLHAQILERLGPSPVPEDQLIRDLAYAPSLVSPEISALELAGKVRREPGGMLARAS